MSIEHIDHAYAITRAIVFGEPLPEPPAMPPNVIRLADVRKARRQIRVAVDPDAA